MRRSRIVRALIRVLQLVTNVHRIHHNRWSYGYTFRPIPLGYFPPFRTGSRREPGELVHYGWRRIEPSDFHDCTWTGRY